MRCPYGEYRGRCPVAHDLNRGKPERKITMKKIMMSVALAAMACGCISVRKNDGGDACVRPAVAKDVVHEKFEIGTAPVTATESLNVICNLISFGKTATHIADQAPYTFWDKLGEVKNGAYANACDQAKCDTIVGTRYNVRVEDYFVFKKFTCEITGYPAKLTGVELIENKTPCACK